MTTSEHTHLLGSEVKANTPPAPASSRATLATSFLVGVLGVLVGAAMVSFSQQPSHYSMQESDIEASNLPLLGKKHHGKNNDILNKKSVVDPGNWLEAFGVSRAVLVESPIPFMPNMLHASGQTCYNGTDFVGDDMADQLAATIANVDKTLALAGMDKCDILKTLVFVTSSDEVLAAWDQYEAWMENCPVPPASTLVAIVRLFRPEVLIEMDVTAMH